MKRLAIALTTVLLISVLSCGSVWAQATAQISGTVRDQSGAVLPGVEVTATQTDTGISRNTVTNETGSYVLPNLAVGPYRLEAGLPGFRTYVQTGIVLQVNSNPTINAVLEVGQITEQVEVQANAAMVETRNSSVGQVIENARILELPLNGRDVTSLITLAGAAVENGTGGLRNGGGTFISVGGGLGYGVEYSLDGANHVNYVVAAGLPMPFPDALLEFKVENSGLTAQHGDAASVGAVTKSGTNEFHGDVFDFVRNDLFNARGYFATSGSTLKRNQFGGTLGGPIFANRLFFFGGYQGTLLRQDPADMQSFVPTAAMLAGDWTAIASPPCSGSRGITLRAPFVNNRIDPALFSKAAVAISNKLPKTSDPCGLVTYGRMSVEDDHQLVGRSDYQWSNQQSFFGRYMSTSTNIPNAFKFTPDNILNTPAEAYDNLIQSAAIGHTYLAGPNTVQSFRFAVNRVSVLRFGNEFFSACDVGVNIYCPYKNILLSVTGGFSIGNSITPHDTFYNTTSFQFNDDVSFVRGTHQLSVGGGLIHALHTSASHSTIFGTLAFNNQETGLGLGDFLTGKLTSILQGAPSDYRMRQEFVSAYATDTWKVRPNVTLNYGVRWEPYLPQIMVSGQMYSFDEERFHQGIKSTVFKNAPAGFYYPGDPGHPGLAGIFNQWANFAPRVGLAWDVGGNGRTSVRASYAYGYDNVSMQWRRDATGSSPYGGRTTIQSPPGGFENPWQGVPGGNPFPWKVGADTQFAPYGLFISPRYDSNTPTTGSWNLSLDKQVASNWVVTTSYIGSLTVHQLIQRPLNWAVYIPGGPCTLNGVTYPTCSTTGNTNQRRRFTLERPKDGDLMGPVSVFDDGGTMNYHGMLVSVRRNARGVTISGNYTLSHCIGDYGDLTSTGPGAEETYTHPDDRRADRGNCTTDRRHLFNATAVAETPQFSNPTVRVLATGWRLSGIYRWSAGSPLNVVAGSDRALNGVGLTPANQRGDQIAASGYGDKSGRPLTNYLDRSAFALPDMGTYGNLGRNSLVGPGTWSFDTALSRIFRVRESQRLEFRAEAYNVTNSFRPGNPGVNLASSTFGQIRTSREPRILQFALKYVF